MGNHERRHTCGGADQRVVGVLDPWQVGGPGGGEVRSNTTEGGLQILIGLLHLAVTLRVVAGRETEWGPQGLTERLPDLGGELGVSV